MNSLTAIESVTMTKNAKNKREETSGWSNWKSDFDTTAFLETHFSPEVLMTSQSAREAVKTFHDIMKDGNYTGEALLDYGCASVLHPTIGASRHFNRIYPADFPENLRDLQRWMRGDPGSFSWAHYFNAYGILEGIQPDVVENRVRSKIAGTIPYTRGLLDSQPLPHKYDQQFDFILVNHVLQVICKNTADYTEALKKLTLYAKPGGYLCICDPLMERSTCLGDQKLRYFPLYYNRVLQSFQEAGLEVVETVQKTFSSSSDDVTMVTDNTPPASWHLTVAKVI